MQATKSTGEQTRKQQQSRGPYGFKSELTVGELARLPRGLGGLLLLEPLARPLARPGPTRLWSREEHVDSLLQLRGRVWLVSWLGSRAGLFFLPWVFDKARGRIVALAHPAGSCKDN